MLQFIQSVFLFFAVLANGEFILPYATSNDGTAFGVSIPSLSDGVLNPFENPGWVGLSDYFFHINQAHRSVFENNFGCAAEHYEAAFKIHPAPFFCDIENYILVNFKNQEQDKNQPYLEILFTKKFLDTAQLFAILPRRVFSEENLAYIARMERQKRPFDKKRYEITTLLAEMDSIFQEVAMGTQVLYSLERDPAQRKTNPNLQYYKQDSINTFNAWRFLQLCKQYGFPSEEMTGVFFIGGRDWSSLVSNLLVSFMRTRYKDDVLAAMENALQNGQLHPAHYARVMEYLHHQGGLSESRYNFLYTTVISGGQSANIYFRPFVVYSDSLMNEVNTNRIRIGLDSFHVEQRQAVGQLFCKEKRTFGQPVITMGNHINMSIYSMGFIKFACEKEGVSYKDFQLNIDKILDKCKCQDKTY